MDKPPKDPAKDQTAETKTHYGVGPVTALHSPCSQGIRPRAKRQRQQQHHGLLLQRQQRNRAVGLLRGPMKRPAQVMV